MKKITILAIHNTIATTVLGPMDVFFQAGQLWNHIQSLPLTPFFEVEIASEDGRPVKCLNNLQLTPHRSIDAVNRTDLVIIPSITGIMGTIRRGGQTLDWLRDHYRQGASIASVCTGAFFLAATGLLDGKTATTHWGFVDLFRNMYAPLLPAAYSGGSGQAPHGEQQGDLRRDLPPAGISKQRAFQRSI